MSTSKLYPLKVSRIQAETPDSISLVLDVPQDLKSVFKFKSGQYLNLETSIDGQKVRRSYSICSAPSESELSVGIKKVPGGLFSTFANETLKVGDFLNVMPPGGNFIIPETENSKPLYVAFSAGSGITPILSIIKNVFHTKPGASFVLFFGNKNTESIMFRETLESLKSKHLGQLSVYHILSREKLGSPLFYGRIDQQKCATFCQKLISPEQVEAFFLCGPGEMIFTVKDQLALLGVPGQKIHFELFSAEGVPLKVVSKKQVNFDPTKESQIEVKLDNERFGFRLPYGGKSILDAALSEGADLPFACKGGVCSTCKARLVKGEVDMEVNYALEQDELDAGYILTCQSHPRTELIEIDFDA